MPPSGDPDLDTPSWPQRGQDNFRSRLCRRASGGLLFGGLLGLLLLLVGLRWPTSETDKAAGFVGAGHADHRVQVSCGQQGGAG